MGDLWLVVWAVGGVAAAYTFAIGGILHARRKGRRWYESVLASQSYGTAVAIAYVFAWLLTGPVWGLVLTPGLLAFALGLGILVQTLAERKARKAVFAREQGK